MKKYNVSIATPVGRTEDGDYVDYFPSRWSGSSGKFKVTTFYPYNLAYLSSYAKLKTDHKIKMIDFNYYAIDMEGDML